jgi:hypothetical protein
MKCAEPMKSILKALRAVAKDRKKTKRQRFLRTHNVTRVRLSRPIRDRRTLSAQSRAIVRHDAWALSQRRITR